ncbi:MAG TPA: sensor histidine kinase [Longimicrobium sp.]|nr:sensor histidine kinase [Longimicrobium sp.]
MTTADPILARTMAQNVRDAREELVGRWLERISDRVAIHPNRVFPSAELLNHVPLLIDGIADYLESSAAEITADIPVVAKAMELGALRHSQGFEAHQILKEYEILGGILFDFLGDSVDAIDHECSRGELLGCAHRVFRAVAVIQQYTTNHFLSLAEARVREREERLRAFNRSLTHEMKNRIGTVRGANEMLREDWVGGDEGQRERFTAIIARNADGMQSVLEDLLELSRVEGEGAPPSRNVLLPDAVAEVTRQLRDFAEARNVTVHLSPELPQVEVPAAAVELCLTNYVSNAIKYRDPGKPDHWVRVEGTVRGDDPCEVVVRVRDNGLGVPHESRAQLFERFFRAHDGTVTGEEGTGLGLAIVRETIESVGGRAWAEFDVHDGTVFAISFPCTAASTAAELPGGLAV